MGSDSRDAITKTFDSFKELAWQDVVSRAIASFVGKIPLLGWGPIGYVLTYWLTKFAIHLYDEFAKIIATDGIKFRNVAYEKVYDRASVELKIIARSGDEEAYAAKRAEHRNSLSNIARFNTARD